MATLVRYILILSLCILSQTSEAASFDEREKIFSRASGALLVVHAETAYDPRRSTKAGIWDAVRDAKLKGLDIYYIVSDKDEEQRRLSPERTDLQLSRGMSRYFLPPIEPNAYVVSELGRHGITLSSNNLVLAGGYLDNCLARAVAETIQNSSWDVFNLTVPMKAVFGGTASSICDDVSTFECYDKYPQMLNEILERFAISVTDLSDKNLKPTENANGLNHYTFNFKMDDRSLPFTFGSGAKVVNVNFLYQSNIAGMFRKRIGTKKDNSNLRSNANRVAK